MGVYDRLGLSKPQYILQYPNTFHGTTPVAKKSCRKGTEELKKNVWSVGFTRHLDPESVLVPKGVREGNEKVLTPPTLTCYFGLGEASSSEEEPPFPEDKENQAPKRAGPHLRFEISSEDGFSVEAESLEGELG